MYQHEFLYSDMTHVKICCIHSVAEARLAVDLGASAIGLVSAMPSGPGVIPETRIGEIADTVPPPIASVLLTSSVSATDIIAQQKRCRVNTIQLCDAVDSGVYRELHEALPGIALIQVIHVRDDASISEALEVAPRVDALLLDSGNPSLSIKELGGTGRTHDWTLSASIVTESSVPVFLAGGLNPENVAKAIRTVGPFGVDVCSGVRTGGRLDEAQLQAFMHQVASAS